MLKPGEVRRRASRIPLIRTVSTESTSGGSLAAVLLLASGAVFVDGMFFTALGPLLPALKHQLRISTSEIGLLNGAYAFGVMVTIIPMASVVAKVGVRPMVVGGLAVFSVTIGAFGVADRLWELLTAQLLSGGAAGAMWLSALTWLDALTPSSRRGAILGMALSATAAGEVLGPVLGGIASTIGRDVAFPAIAGAPALLAVMAALQSDPGRLRPRIDWRSAPQIAGLKTAVWFNALPGLVLGALIIQTTSQLKRLGLSAPELAVVFAVAAALGVLVQPMVGTWSDRRGRIIPMIAGIALCIPSVTGLLIVHSVVLAAALTIVALLTNRVFWTPALALLSDVCDAAGFDQLPGLALGMLALTAGIVAGSALTATITEDAGPATGYVVLGVLLVAQVPLLARQQRRASQE